METINQLWIASYLHEMLGCYIDSRSGERPYSRLYEETLLAAGIVKAGICSCDTGFLEFVERRPGSKAASLYQVIRHFPEDAVKSGAALMIERLTTDSADGGFLKLRIGAYSDMPTPVAAEAPDTARMSVEMRESGELRRPQWGR